MLESFVHSLRIPRVSCPGHVQLLLAQVNGISALVPVTKDYRRSAIFDHELSQDEAKSGVQQSRFLPA
jgi:hypothetical protein